MSEGQGAMSTACYMPYYLPEEATVSFLDAEILYLRYLIVNEHENETCTCVYDTISNQNTELHSLRVQSVLFDQCAGLQN